MKPVSVIKRDGRSVPFEGVRIAAAIARALRAVGVRDEGLSNELAVVVEEHLERVGDAPAVDLESVQDAVVHVLQESGHYEVAIAYARYRDSRERARRERRARGEAQAPVNLHIIDADGRRRMWDTVRMLDRLSRRWGLAGAQAMDVLAIIEDQLAQSPATELAAALVDVLAEAAMVRLGLTATVIERGDVRVPRDDLRLAESGPGGQAALMAAGRAAFRAEAALTALPPAVAKLWSRGRLWVDGLDDPMRGSQLTTVIEPDSNPWEVLSRAASAALDGAERWRRVRVVLPPAILGHLERGTTAMSQRMVAAITSLAQACQVHLYCDGRTPLTERWPFAGGRVGLAIYNDDFLLARQLAERGLPLMSGAQYVRGGWRHRVAVEVALNAQGLEGEWSQLDLLAMGVAAAIRTRLARIGPHADGADLRFAIYGLAAASASADYLDRQVVQEGQRAGLTMVRASNLPEEACAHLGRLLEA